MNVICEKKNKMTFIGYHTEIHPEEAYQKCPEFWDKECQAMKGVIDVSGMSKTDPEICGSGHEI